MPSTTGSVTDVNFGAVCFKGVPAANELVVACANGLYDLCGAVAKRLQERAGSDRPLV